MKRPYLEVTFRRGTAFAAYLYLPRAQSAKAVRTSDEGHGIRVDYDAAGTPIGVEITAPGAVRIQDVEATIARLGLPPIPERDWAPLRAA